MRVSIAATIDVHAPWPDLYKPLPFEYYMAAALGMTEHVKQIVGRMTDGTYHVAQGYSNDLCEFPQFLVLSLGDPGLVETEMRRLKLKLRMLGHIQCWLAITEWHALDVVRDCILQFDRREEVEAWIDHFGRVIAAPEAAVTMLELKLQTNAPNSVRRWLDRNVVCAIAGLIPLVGGKGKLAEAALDFLREKKRQGHAELIASLLGDAPADCAVKVRQAVLDRAEKVYDALDEASTPAWFLKGAARLKGKATDWLPLVSLPPIMIKDRRLNDTQVGQVVAALQNSKFAAEHALVPALRSHAAADSLDAFVWAVFEFWLGTGAPAKDRWGMTALGILGGDRAILQLTPLIRTWPGEGQHQRAVLGLQCLRKIGTNSALMQLNAIAQKLKYKGLKERARQFVEEIAQERGMSRAELEDCIVPDCELDERGNRVFDFGPRQFSFALGADLKPMIRDDAGKLKSDLPKPSAKDDALKAAAAVEAWKLLKKTLREVLRIQAARLEQAMVTGRRWPRDRFEALLLRHPLMTHLVRRLLWGVYDAEERLTACFRVTEEQDLANADDKPFDLGQAQRIGIVHPAHLVPADAAVWGEVFSDYELIPPFAQLGRPIYRLEPEEEQQTDITRFGEFKIEAIVLVGILDRQGWTRGMPEDAGMFSEHSKPFPGANVTAVIQYDGIPIGAMQGFEDQKIWHCFFIPGIYTPKVYPDHKGALKLGDVHPVVLSEVLRDLHALQSKAR